MIRQNQFDREELLTCAHGEMFGAGNAQLPMPGSLCIEGMLQLIGFYLGWLGYPGRGRALGIGEVRFTGQIRPSSKKVAYHIDIKRVMNRKLNICIADGKAFVDGSEAYFAKDLRVCLSAEPNNEYGFDQISPSLADSRLFALP